jgi:filamentous hemagglutinin
MAAAGLLTPQEAKLLEAAHLGSMTDFLGAAVLPSGAKANTNAPTKGRNVGDAAETPKVPPPNKAAMEPEADFAGQLPVRPRDGPVPPSTPATETPLGKHLIEAQVVGSGPKATISGGHNMSNFDDALNSAGGKINSSTEVAPGIYDIKYQLPNGKEQTKTVYGPAKYSDQQMTNMASEAAAKGLMQYQLTGNPRQFVTVGEVTFFVPIRIPGKNFTPDNPAQPYVPTAYPTDPAKVPRGTP